MCFESNESLHQRVVYGLQFFEHRVGKPILARHLPQMLDRVQLKAGRNSRRIFCGTSK